MRVPDGERRGDEKPRPQPPSRRKRRRRMFALILAVMLFSAFELLSYLVIVIGPGSLYLDRASTRLDGYAFGAAEVLEEDPDAIAVFHERFGWWPNLKLSNDVSKVNELGLRAARSYATDPPDGVLRVAAFGDSFVWGHEVRMEDAWPVLVEGDDPMLEVLNFGVTGYGPDQAYLRFTEEAAAVHPHVVIWAVSPWMVRRLVNVFRPFLTKGREFAVKPRYHLDANGGLVLVPQPVATLDDVRPFVDQPELIEDFGGHDHFYSAWVFENPLHDYFASLRLLTAASFQVHRRLISDDRILVGPTDHAVFNVESEAFQIFERLMTRFVAETKAMGAEPVVLIIPDRFSLERLRKGVDAAESVLLESCAEAAPHCWELAKAFTDDAVPLDDWFMPGGHYSPAGNEAVAAWIGPQLDGLR